MEAATGDYYGAYRPGDNLFAGSLVAVDLQWRAQMALTSWSSGIWDQDILAPILADVTINGRLQVGGNPPNRLSFMCSTESRVEPIWPITATCRNR